MGDLDYLVNNILSRRWEKRYEIQPDNVKKNKLKSYVCEI